MPAVLKSTKKIIEQVQVMVEDPEWFLAQDRSLEELGGTRYGVAEYGEKYLSVQNLCRKLEMYNVPLALGHGDLHTVNVAKPSGGGYRYLDFSVTCISFPFIDAITLGFIHDEVGAKFDKLDSSLEMWTKYEPLPRLREFLSLNKEFKRLIGRLYGYQLFLNAEECRREQEREEMVILSVGFWTKFLELWGKN